jgi:hypothetical protein
MNRRYIVERSGRPRRLWWDRVEARSDEGRPRIGVVRELVENGVLQPNDALSALLELRTF